MCGGDIFLALLSILFPPIGVWVKCGICSADSILNIILCCFGYLPGLVHAWYIILKYPETGFDDPRLAQYEPLPNDAHHHPSHEGQVTYYYVSRQSGPNHPHDVDRTYGSINSPHHAQPQVPNTTRLSPQPLMPSQSPQPPQSPPAPQSRPDGPSNATAENAPPPPYAEAVKGDHKMQSQD